jgi:nuclear pore complex protein Nup210
LRTHVSNHFQLNSILTLPFAVNSRSAIRTFAGLERDANHIHTLTHQVINNRLIRVAAVALDPELNPFATAESLTVDWALEDCEGAQWASLAGEDLGLESGLSSNWERGLLLGDRSGKCVVRATVVGLDHKQARVKNIPRKVVHDVEDEIRQKTEKLTDGATLQLVSALRLEPQFALLFNHPAARVTLRVLGGTSDIQAVSNDSKVAEIVQAPPGKTLQVSPKGLGVAEIMVKDVGLEHPTSASAVVAVSDVAWVKVPASEDLVLQVGSNATVAVERGDDLGRPFDPSQFPYLNLVVHFSDETVTLADVPTKAPNEFVIQGNSVGTTTFHVSAEGDILVVFIGRVALK